MADERDNKGRFRPGVSGNPAGRPVGRVDVRTKISRAMLDDAEEIMNAVVEQAKEGDLQAASLVLARVLPTLKPQAERTPFDLDPTAPVHVQIESVVAAIAAGVLSPDVGNLIISSLGTLADARAVAELEERIAKLEGNEE